jgi:tetratricopeptide (TPR) repeat protein
MRNRLRSLFDIGLLLVLAAGCAAPESSSEQSDSENAVKSDQLALAQRAGAPLFDGMSDYQMPITTDSADAQRYFDQGMVLSFAFNHAESIRSFRAAQTLDPSCAMCFWGEALATGPNINVTSKGKVIMSAADRKAAFAALSQAEALKAAVSPRERAYIDALAQRYNGNPDTPREPLDLAWAAAMGELAGQYPEDMTAAAIYAEALMNTMPWNYWSDDGIAKPETSAVIDSLDRVLVKEPDHPLALHLYIHALEASNDPGRAEAAADRLANLVPGAGHLVHMPSHIYYRIGRYNDAAEANIKAADVDEAYIASCNAQGFYPALYYPHNIHFLWAASTMQGQSALSIESARRVVANVRVEQVKAFPTVEFFRTVPLLSLVRFGKWDEILAEPHPHEGFMFAKSIWHYARGVAFAAQGQTSDAKAELGALIPLKDDVSVRFLDSRDYPGSMLVGIAIELLQGEIAYRQGDYDIAIEHFEQAVATQDLLPYTEPPFWYYPTRQSLGAALLANGQLTEAEAIFRRDLELYPHNGWSMFGLAQSLEAQGKSDEADEVRHHFDAAWQFADIELSGAIL